MMTSVLAWLDRPLCLQTLTEDAAEVRQPAQRPRDAAWLGENACVDLGKVKERLRGNIVPVCVEGRQARGQLLDVVRWRTRILTSRTRPLNQPR